MALTNSYVIVTGKLSQVFQQIRDGAAPSKFTTQHLKDWGYTSTNVRALIPLLKSLGFLSDDGTPTSRYHEYRSEVNSKRVMGEAIREAYGDLFTINANPTTTDRALIEGKFKSTHNVSPATAKKMSQTFFALLDLADISGSQSPKIESRRPGDTPEELKSIPPRLASESAKSKSFPSLNYNIEIHLPPTKDIEVFNAIFKSLKEHLLD
jgi:hypothetical protein